MGIGSVALKALRLIPRYAFSDGAKAISKARKATVASGTKSIFGKGNEFALKNSKTKISAGWKALKGDALKTMNSNKGVWASISSFGKSLINKPKAGIRLAKIAAAKAGKTAGFWAKAGGALKGLSKALNKLPIVGTIIAVGFEIPDIYDAFSRGGAWEGTKQVLKSTAKIGGLAAGTALGAVVGGPVGAIIGGIAGDMLVGYLVGGSYSDNHPKETEESEQEQPASNEEANSASDAPSADSSASAPSGSKESESSPSSGSAAESNPSASGSGSAVGGVFNPAVGGMSNPFGIGLNVPNPVSIGMSNPFGAGMGMGMGMNNPFGFGAGMTGGFGYNDPTAAIANSLLAPGENIFLKYPMGYQFQYMG